MIAHFYRIYLNSFLCFSNGLNFVFKHRFLVAKRIHFWMSFSVSGLFLELFLIYFWFIFKHFGSCFVLGRTLGALGANFFITKTVWTTKGAPIGISPKKVSLVGRHFGVIFCDFFNLLSSVLKHRSLLSSEPDFSWILASFRHHVLICLYLSAPLILVFFDNLSI